MTMKYTHLQTLIRIACASTCAAVLLGCDASSGTNPNTTTSQTPDPVVVDFPIVYIERPIPRDEDGNVIADTVLEPSAFKPGARLIFKDRASVSASETVLTDSAFIFVDPDADPEAEPAPDPLPPMYDVKDVTVSYDGLKLLFAMRAPEIENADEDEQPKWNIWEYDRETLELRRIITSNLEAEKGHDIDPNYLSDGRIVFSSTRQPRSKAILLDENKPQFDPLAEGDNDQATFVLHTMDDDGFNIRQITYNQSHDIAPTVLTDGSIVFLRWNNYVGGGHNRFSLYHVQADGKDVSPYYGYHSQNTGTNDSQAAFIDPIQMPGGLILAGLRARESMTQGGDMVLIDPENFSDINQAVNDSAAAGPGQLSATTGQVTTDDSVSPQGYFSSAYPLFDGTGRLLASWSACLVEGVSLNILVSTNGELVNDRGILVNRSGDPLADGDAPVVPEASEIGTYPCSGNVLNASNIAAAPPMYGLWTFDNTTGTQTPVVLATIDTMYTEAVVMEAHDAPAFIDAPIISDDERDLIDANLGVVHIHSVYDFHGIDNTLNGIDVMADPLQTPAAQRPARFLRLIKSVSMPNEDVYDFDRSAFGRSGGQMKDILGYVPVEPDGSVKFQIPADVAFTFSIVDANGLRVPNYLGDRHQNWLTVRPGETRECGGCHARDNELPHGRLDAETPSSYAGAAGGAAFPNTVLLDAFDTPHPAPDNGETMAEYYARINGVRPLNVNIVFDDEWTDASITPKAASYELAYGDLPSAAPPTSGPCINNWNGLCRVVINYIPHIQPMLETPRVIRDGDGMLIEDRTCTSCHNHADSEGQPQVPEDQLDLSSDQSDSRNDYYTSYAELFFPDVPQEVVDGILVDQTEQALDADGEPAFLLDDMGIQVLDVDLNPIPILVTVAARPAYLNPAGARDNMDFFNLFLPGASHDAYMNAAELKLMAEWLDIGAQYYNNPFDAPLAN